MRYRSFDLSEEGIYDTAVIFNRLKNCDDVYDRHSTDDIIYMIFNKTYVQTSGLNRIDLVAPTGTVPTSFFGDINWNIHSTRVLYVQGKEMALSAPIEVGDYRHTYYMLFFAIEEVHNFPEEAISQIMFRIDQLR